MRPDTQVGTQTLQGSNAGDVTPVLLPMAQANATLQGRGTSVALSGGVAPGYYLLPLQGTKDLPFGLTPRHAVSGITDYRIRLCMLRMTQGWVTLYE